MRMAGVEEISDIRDLIFLVCKSCAKIIFSDWKKNLLVFPIGG